MDRRIFAVLAILTIVFLIYASLEIRLGVRYDPPSVYNRGSGGITLFMQYLANEGFRIHVIEDVFKINDFEPTKSIAMVLSPDKTLSDEDTDTILRWVAQGGILVVMDETNNSLSILKKLGISFGRKFYAISWARCYVNGVEMYVIFDVYREVIGGKPLCRVEETVVASIITFGSGRIYVFGDSSLFINNIVESSYRWNQIAFFKNYVLTRKDIVIIEKRIFETLRFRPFLWIPRIITLMLTIVVSPLANPNIGIRVFYLLLVLALTISFIVVAVTRERISLHKLLKRVGHRYPYRRYIAELSRDVVEGIERWREYLRKRSSSSTKY